MHTHVYIYKYLDSISLGECPCIWLCFLGRFVFLLSHSTQICVYCHIRASVSLTDEICSNVYETLITALKCPCVEAAGGICHLLVSQSNGQASCVFLDSLKKFFILFYFLSCFMLFCVLFYYAFIFYVVLFCVYFYVVLCFGCWFVFFCNC